MCCPDRIAARTTAPNANTTPRPPQSTSPPAAPCAAKSESVAIHFAAAPCFNPPLRRRVVACPKRGALTFALFLRPHFSPLVHRRAAEAQRINKLISCNSLFSLLFSAPPRLRGEC